MFRKVLVGVIRHGRKVLDGILKKGETDGVKNGHKKEVLRSEGPLPSRGAPQFQKVYTSVKYGASKGYVQHLAKYARKNLSSELRRQFDKSPMCKEYRGLASKLSMFAFVGVGFASCNKEQDFNVVCEQIRGIFAAKNIDDKKEPLENLTSHALRDYHLGPMIAKGCNAAVYQAKYKTNGIEDATSEEVDEISSDSYSSDVSSDMGMIEEEDKEEESDVEVIEDDFPPATFYVDEQSNQEPEMSDYVFVDAEDDCSDIEVVSDEEEDNDVLFLITCQQDHQKSLNDSAAPDISDTGQGSPRMDEERQVDCDLAIKMMFNYDIESNASALFRGLEKEMLPSRADDVNELLSQWQNGHRSKEKWRLPPHPNIVDMYGGFVDDFPVLPEGLDSYPDALPQRINPDGSGRNKTLFLVMKKYPYTLQEYLRANPDLSIHQSVLLLTQLVDAVVHLSQHGVAHRDLKSDNVFVDVVDGCPHLVISDFGECLCTSDDRDLCVPYTTYEISKGGNMALQAPEIASARPGPDSVLDYNKSDLWTVGTLAYEIFGQKNPFYRSRDGTRLNSCTYIDEDLPSLGDHVPEVIQKLVKKVLSRNPDQRLSPSEVSTYLHLFLWSPSEWSCSKPCPAAQPSTLDLIRWTLTSTARVLLENVTPRHNDSVGHNMRALFLSHLDFHELEASVGLLYGM